jgi:uncharacterized protein (DUF342 family)
MEARQQRGAGLTFWFDQEARALVATVTPDAAAQPIDEAWLREQLSELGYGALRYLPDAGTALLAKYNQGTAVVIKLAECVDASVRITLAPDGLAASLQILPAQGGSPVTHEMVLAALRESGVSAGILPDLIAAAVDAGSAEGIVVARGREPIDGDQGTLESLLPKARSRVPKVDESGHADYRDLGEIQVVHPGDALMQRHPPTEGTQGMNVLGEAILPRPGKEVVYSDGLPGTAFAPGNPDLLLSAITGQPVVVRGGMMVEPLFKVDQVGTASGNITFDGSVVIRGDVSAGMTVKASGDIEIGGVVETATLEAGGSIVIKGGAMGSVGRRSSGEHHIRCGGCFNAAYAQQASIEAGDCIFIDDMAMQCKLSAINHVRVGNRRRGHIVGGSVKATISITANVIGSPNRVHTQLEIGVNPRMHKQLLDLAKERDAKETQLLEVSKLLDLARSRPGKLPAEMLGKARATATALWAGIATLREEEELLAKKIELAQQARVVAQQAIYEGVEVLMGKMRYRVVGEHGPCAIGLGKGGLGLLPVDDEPGRSE